MVSSNLHQQRYSCEQISVALVLSATHAAFVTSWNTHAPLLLLLSGDTAAARDRMNTPLNT
jgi:hypothetical protein